MITCTITDTLLRYDSEQTIQIEKETRTLPALAFCIRTDAMVQGIQPFYHATDTVATAFLPKTEQQLYQAESRQIVEAHGGYVEILENSELLSCLYVLPVAGKQAICFKTDDTNPFEPCIAETAENIQQEKALVELLIAQTTLQKDIVERTIAFTKKAYNNMLRPSGEPYYTHPMEVTRLLLDVTQDPDTLLAGLLHDVVENTSIRLSQIELLYGSAVAHIVDTVTYYNTNGYRWQLEAEEDKSILLETCNDIRVIYIMLANRLHNLRTLTMHPSDDQERIAKDTIAFYIPWAKKHKVAQWLAEMGQLCGQILGNLSE